MRPILAAQRFAVRPHAAPAARKGRFVADGYSRCGFCTLPFMNRTPRFGTSEE
jgi:hypothetical protein